MDTEGGVLGGGRWRGMVLGCLVAGMAAVAGCGGPMVAISRPAADVRRDASLKRNQPQLVMAGPGWLLHVNNDRRDIPGGLVVYRAPRRAGTVADCGGEWRRFALPAGAELVDGSGRAPLYVHSDELVCAASAKGTRVSWHAQPLAAPDALKEALASLR